MKGALLVLACVLTACSHGDSDASKSEFNKLSQIEVSMTPSEVTRIMGRPDAQGKNGDDLVYLYKDRILSAQDIYGGADYQMQFTRGRLVAWGTTTNLLASPRSTGLFVSPY